MFRSHLREAAPEGSSRQLIPLAIGGSDFDLPQFLTTFQVEGVQDIWLGGGSQLLLAPDCWRVFFAHHPEIATLGMGESVTPTVLEVVANGGQAEASSRPPLPLVPHPTQEEINAAASSVPPTSLPNLLTVQLANHLCQGGTDMECDAFEGARTLLRGRTGQTAVSRIELIVGVKIGTRWGS